MDYDSVEHQSAGMDHGPISVDNHGKFSNILHEQNSEDEDCLAEEESIEL